MEQHTSQKPYRWKLSRIIEINTARAFIFSKKFTLTINNLIIPVSLLSFWICHCHSGLDPESAQFKSRTESDYDGM